MPQSTVASYCRNLAMLCIVAVTHGRGRRLGWHDLCNKNGIVVCMLLYAHVVCLLTTIP